VAFSRSEKSWKLATGPGKFWKSFELVQRYVKNMKCLADNKRINMETMEVKALM